MGFDEDKSWADEARDFFDDYVNDEIENGACDGSFGWTLSCAALALEKAAFEAFVADALNVAEDAYNGEIDLETAIELGLVVCKICKFGEKVEKLVDKVGDKAKKLLKKTCSFEAGTLVLTSDGYKPIEEVKIGDWVWSKDENNEGQWLWRPVTDTSSHLHDDGIELTVENADGTTSTITTTSEHPFYSDDQWQRADQLEAGMLLTTTSGELIISASTHLLSPLRAYNMTVGDTHTYTVGEEQIWVHNECDLTKTDRIKEHVLNGELDAARREKLGEVVARKSDGTPWDHVTELLDAQNGLLKQIKRLKKELGRQDLDSATRRIIEEKLGEASRLLDKTEEYLPR